MSTSFHDALQSCIHYVAIPAFCNPFAHSKTSVFNVLDLSKPKNLQKSTRLLIWKSTSIVLWYSTTCITYARMLHPFLGFHKFPFPTPPSSIIETPSTGAAPNARNVKNLVQPLGHDVRLYTNHTFYLGNLRLGGQFHVGWRYTADLGWNFGVSILRPQLTFHDINSRLIPYASSLLFHLFYLDWLPPDCSISQDTFTRPININVDHSSHCESLPLCCFSGNPLGHDDR